jgi:hypothetical protein
VTLSETDRPLLTTIRISSAASDVAGVTVVAVGRGLAAVDVLAGVSDALLVASSGGLSDRVEHPAVTNEAATPIAARHSRRSIYGVFGSTGWALWRHKGSLSPRTAVSETVHG